MKANICTYVTCFMKLKVLTAMTLQRLIVVTYVKAKTFEQLTQMIEGSAEEDPQVKVYLMFLPLTLCCVNCL